MWNLTLFWFCHAVKLVFCLCLLKLNASITINVLHQLAYNHERGSLRISVYRWQDLVTQYPLSTRCLLWFCLSFFVPKIWMRPWSKNKKSGWVALAAHQIIIFWYHDLSQGHVSSLRFPPSFFPWPFLFEYECLMPLSLENIVLLELQWHQAPPCSSWDIGRVAPLIFSN